MAMTEKYQYRCKENDTVDWICWRHYGRQSGAVEAVFDANRGLAEYGPTLPAGLLIDLPELATTNIVDVVRLWD